MMRFWLVAICVVMLGLAMFGMLLGWRNRLRRQAALPTPPAVPDPPGELRLGPVSGLYVGTTFATSWQDRVVHDGLGLRATATAMLYATGVLLEREGARPVFVPFASIIGARLAPGLAGKVVGAGGLLVVSWRLGDAELDTAFRADDKTIYPAWVRAINAPSDVSARSETANSPSPDDGIRHSAEKGSGE